MSDFQDFRNSKLLRHPTTWVLVAIAGVYGGTNMYLIREGKRAAGAERQWPWLGLERAIDITFGALVEILIVMMAVWMLAGLVEHLAGWKRFVLLLAVLCGLHLLKFII